MSEIALTLAEPLSSEIDVSTRFSLFVTISTRPACDLRNAPFAIKESDRIILVGQLADLKGERHDTAEIVLTAPERVGEFTWTLNLPPREVDGLRYNEASLAFSFSTRAHTTSLAVWGARSPIQVGETVSVNVGAKCMAGCTLAGLKVDVRDAAGQTAGHGSLGATPWPATTALFWTSLAFTAPAEQGHFAWSVGFSAADLALPHRSASASFGFVTVGPSDHAVSVRVVTKETGTPLADVQVRFGPHRLSTDEAGIARIDVPSGEHAVSTWKAGYNALDTSLCVAASTELLLEMTACPDDDPFAFWRG